MARLLAAAYFCVAFLAAAPVLADAAAPAAGTDVMAAQKPVLEGYAHDVQTLASNVEDGKDDDSRLVELRQKLDDLAQNILQAAVTFRPRLDQVNARLEQIGPPPAEGKPAEAQSVTDERKALQDEKAAINDVLDKAQKSWVQAYQLIGHIGDLRRDLFTRTLSKRYDIRSALSAQTLKDFRGEVSDLYARLASWLHFVMQFELRAMLLATFFALAAVAALLIGGRHVFGRLIFADPQIEQPSYITRLSVAFWSTLLPSAALAVFLSGTYFLYAYYGVLRSDIAEIVVTLFNVIAVVFMVYRLTHAVFLPALPNWRLVPVSSQGARTLLRLTFLMVLFTGLDHVLSRISVVMGSPLSLTIAKNLLATVAVGALVIAVGLVRPLEDEQRNPRPWPAIMRYGIVALGTVTLGAAILGYIGLARFIVQQLVVTAATLATMYIGYLSARAVGDLGALRETGLGAALTRRFGLDDKAVDQLGLVFSISINLLVLCIGIPVILLQWGFQWSDVGHWVYSVASEIRIGSVSFSLIGILTGIIVFVIGYVLTRWLQSWLDGSVMTRGRVDSGVRNSIRTGVGYAGIIIAALIGLSAAGINLSSLALVAGALSLGVGFGLQNVVSNFVSGLILLVERPFKAGDWIVAGNITGTVKKISVRATEIETFQRQTVILPNSELINSAVGNWTHRNKLGRVEIPVSVAYGSDARKVHKLLVEIAASHPLVLKNPAPFVVFTGFGNSSLDFEIRVYLSDILDMLAVQNEIRFSVVETFKREGIEIPFPQRDIHIRSGLDGMSRMMANGAEAEAAQAPVRQGRRRRPDPDAPG